MPGAYDHVVHCRDFGRYASNSSANSSLELNAHPPGHLPPMSPSRYVAAQRATPTTRAPSTASSFSERTAPARPTEQPAVKDAVATILAAQRRGLTNAEAAALAAIVPQPPSDALSTSSTSERDTPRARVSLLPDTTSDAAPAAGRRSSISGSGVFNARLGSSMSGRSLALASAVSERFVSKTAMLSFRTTEEDDPVLMTTERFSAVLFVDLSGYSAVTHALASQGAFVLSEVVNSAMSPLVDECVAFGGDVVKFAGDAIVVVWPSNGDDAAVVQSAAACACELQRKYPIFPVAGTDLSFEMHIGLTCGELHSEVIRCASLRTMQQHWHYVAGEPLRTIGTVVDAALPTEVMASAAAAAMLSSTEFGKQPRPEGVLITAPADVCAEYRDNCCELVMPEDVDFARAATHQQQFIHPAIAKRLAVGASPLQLAEMRLLGVMFIDQTTSIVATADWFAEVLAVLDKHRCGVVQLIDDDKGLHVVAAANLHVAVSEPAVAAVQATSELLRRRLGVTVGIAVGTTLCGVVGSSNACRWDITSAACVRACRLMQHAKSVKRAVIADVSVAEKLVDQSLIAHVGEASLKGSPDPVPVYTLSAHDTAVLDRLVTMSSRVSYELHDDVHDQLRRHVIDAPTQRALAIVAGSSGTGKMHACLRALHKTSIVAITHSAIPNGPQLQVATALHEWFLFHPHRSVSALARELRDAVQQGHVLRTMRAAMELVRKVVYRHMKIALVVRGAQYLDDVSMSLVKQLTAPAAHTIGYGRFIVLFTFTPLRGLRSAAALRTSLDASLTLLVTLAPLTDAAGRSQIRTRLGWDCGEHLEHIILRASSNLPACIDHTIAMIQRQRPYITKLDHQGVVSADVEAVVKIRNMSWTVISPELCAQVQHVFDSCDARAQALLRALAVLLTTLHQVPKDILVNVTHAMLTGVSCEVLTSTISSLVENQLLIATRCSVPDDEFMGAIAAELERDVTCRADCVGFVHPALRDLIRNLTTPSQQKQLLRLAAGALERMTTMTHPVHRALHAYFHVRVHGTEAAATAFAEVILQLRDRTDTVATGLRNFAAGLVREGTLRWTAPPLTYSALITVAPAGELLPLKVVQVKNYVPPYSLGPAVVPLLVVAWTVKAVVIRFGRGEPAHEELRAAASAVDYVSDILAQIDRIVGFDDNKTETDFRQVLKRDLARCQTVFCTFHVADTLLTYLTGPMAERAAAVAAWAMSRREAPPEPDDPLLAKQRVRRCLTDVLEDLLGDDSGGASDVDRMQRAIMRLATEGYTGIELEPSVHDLVPVTSPLACADLRDCFIRARREPIGGLAAFLYLHLALHRTIDTVDADAPLHEYATPTLSPSPAFDRRVPV